MFHYVTNSPDLVKKFSVEMWTPFRLYKLCNFVFHKGIIQASK